MKNGYTRVPNMASVLVPICSQDQNNFQNKQKKTGQSSDFFHSGIHFSEASGRHAWATMRETGREEERKLREREPPPPQHTCSLACPCSCTTVSVPDSASLPGISSLCWRDRPLAPCFRTTCTDQTERSQHAKLERSKQLNL